MTFWLMAVILRLCSLKPLVIRERNSPSRCVSKGQTRQKSQSVYSTCDVVIIDCFQGHWMYRKVTLVLYFLHHGIPALVPLLFAVMSVQLFLNLRVSHTPGRDGTKWPGTALFHRCSVIFVVREEKVGGGFHILEQFHNIFECPPPTQDTVVRIAVWKESQWFYTLRNRFFVTL